jgi:hypothetical protein
MSQQQSFTSAKIETSERNYEFNHIRGLSKGVINKMKKKLALMCLIIAIIFSVENKNTAEANISVGFNLFFDALSPYGNWVSVPTYGNVWYPTNVQPHWRPYTDGRWVWSDYGWTWVSYEPWGWAPYHYGRWIFLDYYGWVWIPGTVWAPAWVTWYTSPGYIGWAPLAPDNEFFLQIGIGFNSYNYYTPHNHCVFAPSHKFLHHHVHSIVVPQSHNVKIFKEAKHINNVKIVNNNVINRGPNVDFVERASRTKVEKVNLVERDIDTHRIIKNRSNVNKLDGRNYYIFRPDKVREDRQSPTPNGEPLKNTIQIENTDYSVSSENNPQELPNRKHPKLKKESLKNTLKISDNNDLIYPNNKAEIKNYEGFQNKNNLEDAPHQEYKMTLDNKRRNSLKRNSDEYHKNREVNQPNYSNVKKVNNKYKKSLYPNNHEKPRYKYNPINPNKKLISSQNENINKFQNLDRQSNNRYRGQENTGRKFLKESSRRKHNRLN